MKILSFKRLKDTEGKLVWNFSNFSISENHDLWIGGVCQMLRHVEFNVDLCCLLMALIELEINKNEAVHSM